MINDALKALGLLILGQLIIDFVAIEVLGIRDISFSGLLGLSFPLLIFFYAVLK